MKKRYYIFCALVTTQILNADSLSERKAELERQIREIEAQQIQQEEQKKQKEIEELEQKLKGLQYAYPKEKLETNPVHQEIVQNNKIAQEIDNEEAKKWFGKNRSGVLLGISAGIMPLEYKTPYFDTESGIVTVGGARLGYQYFSNNNSVFGFRIYMDAHYGYGITDDIFTDIQQNFAAFNIDLLLDWRIPNTYNYIGLFGGFGIRSLNFEGKNTGMGGILSKGYLTYLKGGRNFLNFGLAASEAKHRFELYLKIPIKTATDEKIDWKSPVLVAAAYQYTF